MIREIVNRYPVVDLSVSEPDIEEVVTRIYRESARRRPDTGGVDLDRPPERRSAIRRG